MADTSSCMELLDEMRFTQTCPDRMNQQAEYRLPAGEG